MQRLLTIIAVLSCLVATICIVQVPFLTKRSEEAKNLYDKLNAGFIPSSCNNDVKFLCEQPRSIQPLQTILRIDPFVRIITITPMESSPESSSRILDDLFADPWISQHNEAPESQESPLKDGVSLGVMMEQMMKSAMRFSSAAEEVVSSHYYGTRENAAEDTFITMLNSFFDLSDQSSGTEEYYHDPNELRKSVCNYGKTVLSNESEDESEFMTVDNNQTRLRLARRLSELETAPKFPDVSSTFITSFRSEFINDQPVASRQTMTLYPEDEDHQKCLWNARSTGMVSYPCEVALDDVAAKMLRSSQEYRDLYHKFRTNIAIGVASSIIGLILFMVLSNEGNDYCEDHEDDFGNDHHAMSESTKCDTNEINQVYTGVPYVPLRVV